MTNVKCDVQLIVTSATPGSGKSELTTRILKAVQSDSGLSKICKIHPDKSYESRGCETTQLSFNGDLGEAFQQGREVRKGIYEFKFPNGTSVFVWKPHGPDKFQGSSYSYNVACDEKRIYDEDLKRKEAQHYAAGEPENDIPEPKFADWYDAGFKDAKVAFSEYEPRLFWADPEGRLCLFPDKDRISVGLLMARTDDAKADPVGMDQEEAKPAKTDQPGAAAQGYIDRTALFAPKDDLYPLATATLESLVQGFAAKFQRHSGINGSILKGNYWVIFNNGMLKPVTHSLYTAGSNEPIPVYYAERETDEIDAHIAGCPAALNTLSDFRDEVQKQFQKNDFKGGAYPGGLVAGDKIQIISDNGDVIIGETADFVWRKGGLYDIIYWRRLGK